MLTKKWSVLVCLYVASTFFCGEGASFGDQEKEESFIERSHNLQFADCKCENGYCEKVKNDLICKCHPGWGRVPSTLLGDEYCKGCSCKNGRCVTDNRGKTKCNCKPGYSPQDEYTCEPCDCGERGKCIFVGYPKSAGGLLYQKKCICDVGSAEKDGTCIDCHCGENSKCEFEGDEKICYCIDGYSEKDGVCTRCDCGDFGECYFKTGQKTCTCDEGYLEHDGNCKECDCGEFGTCYLDKDGAKVCACNDGFSNNDGKCEECDCGVNGLACGFVESRKICHCSTKTSQLRDKCVDCDCGEKSEGCEFIFDTKVCDCYEGYVQKGEVCKVSCSMHRQCQNGGHCKNGICKCLPGTSGEFCEVIEACDLLCPNRSDINCTYDSKGQKAYCECLNENMGYHPDTRDCKRTCDDYSSACQNGGICVQHEYSRFCECLDGTEGDSCETVPECSVTDCGTEATCRFDVVSKTAVCTCLNGDEVAFDPTDRKCKKTCGDQSDCKNGGMCIGSTSSKFCRCLSGTKGDYCEEVLGCIAKDCGYDAECVYDVDRQISVCKCIDENFDFDPVGFRCKKTCGDQSDCKNGGMCIGSASSKFCRCLSGTKGDICEEVLGCIAKDCGYDAECVYDVDRQISVCKCIDENFDFDPVEFRCKKICRDSSDCENGGTCEGGNFKEVSSRFCRCLEGTEGDACEKVPECDAKDCGYDAECVYDQGRKTASCLCKDSEHSFDPVDRKCKRPCSNLDESDESEKCQNGATCEGTSDDNFCKCLKGTTGDMCETITECESESFKECRRDKGKCGYNPKYQRAECECTGDRKFYTKVGYCEVTCKDTGKACEDGKVCNSDKFCVCNPGYGGDGCTEVLGCTEDLQKECKTAEATCVHDETGPPYATCKCNHEGYAYDKTAKKCKGCDCGGRELSCSIRDGKKICVCPEGFSTVDGQCRKERCTDKKCLHGKCDVVIDDEVCSCFEGYTLVGDECRKLNCSSTSCTNGTCIVRHGGKEECICPAGFTLKGDLCIKGQCRIDTCYGGQCEIIDGELMCVCPERFHLDGIGCYETVCTIQMCFGGKCVVRNDTEICTCLDGYILENDVCKKILCEKKNCFGGKCDLIDGEEVCTCPPGFSLFEDVCRENLKAHKKEEEESMLFNVNGFH